MNPLHLQIKCLNIPAEINSADRIVFGLQDKQQHVQEGITQADGSLLFECEIEVKLKNGEPDFTGSFVQGTAGKRFIYLSLGRENGGTREWIRRLKIPLTGIAQFDHRLQAVVDGRKSGTVEIIGGWTPVD